MKRKIIGLLFVFLAISALFAEGTLLAAPYYKGKVVTLICGAEVGGGYDLMARLMARHIGKHIPGNPTIIVRNMPGAIGTIAANYLYNIAAPDGLTFATFNRGLSFGQLQKAPGIKFDLTKFQWLGSPSVESTVLTIRSSIPYKTFADLRKATAPINIGCTGTTGTDYSFLVLLQEFTGVKFKIVLYPGGSAVLLAIERGEVDARAGSYSSLQNFVKRGVVRPILRGNVSEPEIEGLPVDEDQVSDKKGKVYLSMRSLPDRIGRPYAAPPGTPAHIMKILRKAFADTVQDPSFIKDAGKVNVSPQYVSGEKSLETFNALFNQPADIISEFNKFVKF